MSLDIRSLREHGKFVVQVALWVEIALGASLLGAVVLPFLALLRV